MVLMFTGLTSFFDHDLFQSDEVYLEAQVQNITSGPISLEKVSLESSHLFNGKSFSS